MQTWENIFFNFVYLKIEINKKKIGFLLSRSATTKTNLLKFFYHLIFGGCLVNGINLQLIFKGLVI